MLHQDSLKIAAIRYTLERLKESARQSGYFLPAFFIYFYPQKPQRVTYYLEVLLVQPNGQIVSTEFQDYLKENKIAHRTAPPYHPSTNGFAQNMVVPSKKHRSKALANIKMEFCDCFVWLSQRATFHYHLAPAHLMLAKAPCTHLAMTHPNVANRVMQQLVPCLSKTLSKVCKLVVGTVLWYAIFIRRLLLRSRQGQ